MNVFVILLLLLSPMVQASYVIQEPCIEEFYTTETTCHWKWFRRVCRYYLQKHEKCCDGYAGVWCDIPICNGGAVENSCNIDEGWVKLRDNTIITSSGGTCSGPLTCSDCNTGYYVSTTNNGTCSACKQIANCNIPSCNDYDDTFCEWCDGELDRDVPGYNVFTGKPDNKLCQRACSWRDGYRCFPGTCLDNMVYPNDCTCAAGFTGTNCATVKEDNPPAILTQSLILEGDGDVSKLIADMPLADGKFWSNEAQWLSAEISASSSYKPTIDGQNVPGYISAYSIGIEDITLTATLSRGNDESKWITQGDCQYKERCETITTSDLKQTPWNTVLQGGFPSPFRHMDEITFMMSTRNGGQIKYIDRESESEKVYYLNGVTVTNTLVIGFDFYPPVHCFETSYTCSQDSLYVEDFNKDAQTEVTWGGWTDSDAGISKYIITLKYLSVKDLSNPILEENKVVSETTIGHDQVSTTVSFDNPGPYSVEITAFDKADNYKVSRRIVLYDDSSFMEKLDPLPKVVQANEFSWINIESSSIEVSWVGRYINTQHHTHGWLNEVKDNPDVSQDLDDTGSRSVRGVDALYNIQGIVLFEIGYTSLLNGQSSVVNLATIPNKFFALQKNIYEDIELTDGKRLTFRIRGYDVLENYAEDNVTVTVDLSAPIIQNLWLTNGDFVNISVHNLLELNNLTFEWEVYDEHSGLYELEWRIFDNFTNTDIQHGHSFESLQGGASQTVDQCEEIYQDYPRGHNCYCSPYNGCYHRHYQITPQMTNTGTDGIHSGKDIGVHDYDYFIEVTAINNARLKTVATHKFSIDVSLPHEGTVHDGIYGQPEVDFQQSFDLHAHWADFFDRESSVWFYLYGFHTECLLPQHFDVHVQNEKITKTFEKSATYTAPSTGKYFVTVVAVNQALGVSKPVCSDGVIIDATPATISEVVVKDAVIAHGLIKDETTGDIYLLDRNRELEYVNDSSYDCIDKALTVSSEKILLMPHRRNINGEKRNISLQDCSLFTDLNNNLLAFITSASHLEVSWNVSVGVSGLNDMEIGISSTESNVPDIMAFETTHGHQHKILYHPDIFNGETFFIVIKTITKSAVSDIKSIGPFVLDRTKPVFQGSISLSLESDHIQSYIVVRWEDGAFVDHGDPHPLKYEIAIGSSKDLPDILCFQSIGVGGSCDGQNCAAVSTDLLPWKLHALQTYYVAIKATNTVGMFVIAWSEKYRDSVMKATTGMVYDVDIDSEDKLVDIDDIDYQSETHQLSARWFGFQHPYEEIQFYVCVVETAVPDINLKCEKANTDTTHTFSDLSLDVYQTYSTMLIAETSGGNISALSNGVTIVVDGDILDDAVIYDGIPCNVTNADDFNEEMSHHSEDKKVKCKEDVEYQSSTNRLQAYWSVGSEKVHLISDIYWAIEQRAPVEDNWIMYKEYDHLRAIVNSFEDSDLALTPGRKYRVVLQFCAGPYCFQPVKSSGVTVIPNPPVPGSITVEYITLLKQITINIDRFKDPDIQSLDEAYAVMDHYEWAVVDNSINTKLLTKWKTADNINIIADKVSFTVDLDTDINFTKCWAVSVRGYNKVGYSAIVFTNIKNCSDIKEVRPNIVIDAIGDSTVDDPIGKSISLQENSLWPLPDVDYTPYSNVLSAVWPTLRHKSYTWSILSVRQDDVIKFFNKQSEIDLQQPCSHPDSIKCGSTGIITSHPFVKDLNYVNVYFESGTLNHGHRYVICVHANATMIHHELWIEELSEVNECSDGVTIDLTPPLPGDVWIGNQKDARYKTSTSELGVNWGSFIDIEEEGYTVHSSGIKGYELAIGSSQGGVDVVSPTMVGLTNHKMFHNLSLVNGRTYYATLKGYDFAGQSSVSYSEGVTIETTPPVISDGRITVQNRHITSTEYVEACWSGLFSDNESGISHYSWSIGTQSGFDNTMNYRDTENVCVSTPQDEPLALKEGHTYIINVKAYNNVGLFSVASSWAFIVDSSEPETGDVYDGSMVMDTNYVDLDYLDTSSSVHIRWKGFFDPHTPIKEYFVSMGSCKGCDNIIEKQPKGLQEHVEMKYLHLAEGIKYFVTVTACNTADLCSSASSDGFIVDTTPPIKGYVLDGTLAKDIQYQSARTYIGCKWYGFNDPQSRISKYVWRAGTSKGADDIVVPTDCHYLQEVFVYDLTNSLPLNTRIYCTVRAYNKAGLVSDLIQDIQFWPCSDMIFHRTVHPILGKYVESSSNGFLVDVTPPIFDTSLTLSNVGSIKDDTSVLRTMIRVNWAVHDEQSFIMSQHLSISSHIGGDFNLSSVQVEGIVRDYTLTNLDLHDGSHYDIKLTSCNGAKLCTESILHNVLVDSSPPTKGMFAVNTDHAASLNRQPDLWMTWTPISISLAWLGFEDTHSGIESYLINIGSIFMGNDLNEVAGEPYVITHRSTAPFYEDGFVQTYKLNTKPLSKHSSLYVSISARNAVGLSSEIVHAQFNLLFGGILEIIRRCEAHTCYGHCVCAVEGQLCLTNDDNCVDSSGIENGNSFVEVEDVIDITFPSVNTIISWSPCNTMLAARWTIKTVQGKTPKWYECSVGESSFDSPQGIFHEVDDRVWYDAGQNTQCIVTLKRGESLVEGEKYSVFVRVWYNKNTFAIFQSPGVIIHSTPPELSIVLGRNVKEVMYGESKDTDFVTLKTKVKADWSGKFQNNGDSLLRYHLYISTSPGGHDTLSLSSHIAPDVTSYNITGLNLEENTQYYTVVQAYNKAGLHSTAVSDGFMLDLHPPQPGIVLDGKSLVDIDVSNDSHTLSAFWHGFTDLESGIISYDFCISSTTYSDYCDILPMTSVGNRLSKTYHSPTTFKQGHYMYSKVRAHDAAGYTSDIVSSNGLKVDTTPPVIMTVGDCSNNILTDHSFEISPTFICDKTNGGGSWFISGEKCADIETSSMAHDGNMFAIIQLAVDQMVMIEHTGRYRLTLYTSTVLSDGLRLSAVEGFVSLNSEKHVFSLYEKHSSNSYAWQKHTFFFDININNVLLSIGVLRENSAFALDDVKLEYCGNSSVSSSNTKGQVKAHTVFVHDWSSIHADWTFSDPESDIIEYIWAIGTVEGGTQIQTFKSVGRQSYGRAEGLYLDHNTEVFVTVVAINEAELKTVSYSSPIIVDLTPPVLTYITDGEVPGEDIDYQSELTLMIHWNVDDLESGVIGCSWGLGTSPGDTSIQNFTSVDISLHSANLVFEHSPNKTIFATVRCVNRAGLTETASSDGIQILQYPPSVHSIILHLMTTSLTQYLPRGYYHGNSSEIKFRWTGFDNHDNVDSFEIDLTGNNVEMSEIVPATTTGYNYASFTGLDLADGEYVVSVTAINKVYMKSERKSETFYLLTEPPKLTGNPMNITWIKSGSTVNVSWENVFESEHPVLYEVTVSLGENGQGDLIQWRETEETFTDIQLEPDDYPNTMLSVDITVKAISYSGLCVIRHDNLLIII